MSSWVKLLWQIGRVFAELILLLVLVLVALALIDLYMVASGEVSPGNLMFMHETPTLGDLLFQLSVLLPTGGAAFVLRQWALRKLAV